LCMCMYVCVYVYVCVCVCVCVKFMDNLHHLARSAPCEV